MIAPGAGLGAAEVTAALLLAAGADPDLRRPAAGASVFLDLCQTAKAPVIAALIAAGADLDARDNAGKGIEFYARSNHRARAVIAEHKGLPPRPADGLRARLKDLPARARAPRFATYAQSLGAALGRHPSGWKRRKGGLCFHDVSAARIHAHLGEPVPAGDDARRHDAALARLAAEARAEGAVLFHCGPAAPGRFPLVLLPIADSLAPVIAGGTNANARGGTDYVFESRAAIAAAAPWISTAAGSISCGRRCAGHLRTRSRWPASSRSCAPMPAIRRNWPQTSPQPAASRCGGIEPPPPPSRAPCRAPCARAPRPRRSASAGRAGTPASNRTPPP